MQRLHLDDRSDAIPLVPLLPRRAKGGHRRHVGPPKAVVYRLFRVLFVAFKDLTANLA
jgi:hypothetical protein